MLPLFLPSVTLWCWTELCGSLPQQHMIKGIVIWGVKRLDVRADVIAEIFRRTTLSSPACVAWRRVLFPAVRSFSSYLLDHSSRHSMEAFRLSLKPCGKMNGSITSPSLVAAPNTMIWIRCLPFVSINTSCGDRESQHFIQTENFLI